MESKLKYGFFLIFFTFSFSLSSLVIDYGARFNNEFLWSLNSYIYHPFSLLKWASVASLRTLFVPLFMPIDFELQTKPF